MKPSFLHLRNCRQHNLKHLSLDLPKNHIIVMTGVSGSGKSSLAFDTLFAEGQRRYLEYLSPQARSWIKQMPKPDVDLIDGLSPTLAIGQGRQALYSKGTVATYTDIYDFLALLFANIGEQHSPMTGKRLIRYSRQEIIDLILKEYRDGTRIQLLAPIKLQREKAEEALIRLQQMGFIRFKINDLEWKSDEPLPPQTIEILDVIVDRLEMKEGIRERLGSSVEMGLEIGQGILKIQEGREGSVRYFTEIYVCPETSYAFAPLSTADFNFNSPRGACPVCQGQGGKPVIHEDLLDQERPLSEQIEFFLDYLPKKTASSLLTIWHHFLLLNDCNEETLLSDVSLDFQKEVLRGSSHVMPFSTLLEDEKQHIKVQWKGIIPILEQAIQEKKIKGALSDLNFAEWQVCPVCHGSRLKPESLSCLIEGKGIHHLCALTVSELIQLISQWKFENKQALVAQEILPQIQSRLRFLEQVGLGYLELDRQGRTLSDGETQRIQLASQIGAKLSGIVYILDEPSLGLHRQDIGHLQQVIQELKELGNTVILVEHERSLMRQADQLIELGPGAGVHGGHLIFQGTYQELLKDPYSLTGQWLSGRLTFPKPPKRKPKKSKLSIQHATLHNLKDFSVNVPLGCLVGFCGVSGSGKSTLALDIIGKEIERELKSGEISSILKGRDKIQRLITSQKKEDRFSARSIPATYVDLMTPLRNLFAETRLAKARGYSASRFSLNKRGGRCEACEGLGEIRVSMQFMPDIFVPCEVCNGLRYNYETLQVTWENRNIAEILALSVEEAYEAFQNIPAMAPQLKLMKDLGLEYLTLGQSFNTLSSGEVQRLKLVADLASRSLEPTLYILDEPSAGLHFQDIEKLIKILHRLVENGHSVFVVEHHLDILRQADWLIELGPGGGPHGGNLIFEGTPDKMMQANTPTGKVLKDNDV